MSSIKIVYYHDIALTAEEKKAPRCYGPTVKQFREQMEFLKSNWDVLSIKQIVYCCKTGEFPKKPSVGITFDDGLAGVMEAAEVLLDLNLPAMVFLSTRFIDNHELAWFIHLDDILTGVEKCGGSLVVNGRQFKLNSKDERAKFRKYAKKMLLQKGYDRQMQMFSEWAETLGVDLVQSRKAERTFLTWKQIEELANRGIDFGSHTHSHVDPCVLEEAELEEEFARSVQLIAEKIGKEYAKFVCYPDGRFDRKVISVAKKYHECAFAAMESPSWKDIFRLPRRYVSRGGVGELEYALSWRMMFDYRLKRYVKSIFRIP